MEGVFVNSRKPGKIEVTDQSKLLVKLTMDKQEKDKFGSLLDI